mmetsp:Transcript_7622/g.47027  ORF Transcript_7622/g.47027 Transcript_7622/m.47027 type:complete len:229 (+) Transcript_7622:885-1571(+)
MGQDRTSLGLARTHGHRCRDWQCGVFYDARAQGIDQTKAASRCDGRSVLRGKNGVTKRRHSWFVRGLRDHPLAQRTIQRHQLFAVRMDQSEAIGTHAETCTGALGEFLGRSDFWRMFFVPHHTDGRGQDASDDAAVGSIVLTASCIRSFGDVSHRGARGRSPRPLPRCRSSCSARCGVWCVGILGLRDVQASSARTHVHPLGRSGRTTPPGGASMTVSPPRPPASLRS